MDSVVAIARGIAGLDTEREINDCLSAILNLELLSSKLTPVNKTSYIREIESRYETWDSGSEEFAK